MKKGFTLIELVIVMILLGILAAVAVPKFLDLRQDAEKAVAQQFAGALREASQLFFARSILDGEANPEADDSNDFVDENATIGGYTPPTNPTLEIDASVRNLLDPAYANARVTAINGSELLLVFKSGYVVRYQIDTAVDNDDITATFDYTLPS